MCTFSCGVLRIDYLLHHDSRGSPEGLWPSASASAQGCDCHMPYSLAAVPTPIRVSGPGVPVARACHHDTHDLRGWGPSECTGTEKRRDLNCTCLGTRAPADGRVPSADCPSHLASRQLMQVVHKVRHEACGVMWSQSTVPSR